MLDYIQRVRNDSESTGSPSEVGCRIVIVELEQAQPRQSVYLFRIRDGTGCNRIDDDSICPTRAVRGRYVE